MLNEYIAQNAPHGANGSGPMTTHELGHRAAHEPHPGAHPMLMMGTTRIYTPMGYNFTSKNVPLDKKANTDK